MTQVKALLFDTFGTVVDWRNGIARDAAPFLAKHGIKADPHGFADAWRKRYRPGMKEVIEANLAAFLELLLGGTIGIPRCALGFAPSARCPPPPRRCAPGCSAPSARAATAASPARASAPRCARPARLTDGLTRRPNRSLPTPNPQRNYHGSRGPEATHIPRWRRAFPCRRHAAGRTKRRGRGRNRPLRRRRRHQARRARSASSP
jgi:hypothetical protein